MKEYSQGICQDGAAILEDGRMMTIEQILEKLNNHERLVEALKRLSEVVDAGPEYKVSLAKNRIAAIENARTILQELEGEL